MSLENIRLMPHDLEVEMMVISQLILSNESLYKIIDIKLKPNDFYSDDFKKIYLTILKLIGEGKMADVITIQNKLGIEIDDDIILKALTTSGIKEYAQIIKDYGIKRELIKLAYDIEMTCYNKDSQIENIKIKSDGLLKACFAESIQKDFIEELTDIYEGLYEDPTDVIKTNYKVIDKKLRLSKGQLVTIAGRPGVGKSAVMGCLALSMSNIAFFSLEMQNREIAYRMASNISNIPYSIISNGIKNQPEDIQSKISSAFSNIIEKSPNVYDKKMTMIDIKLEMKKLKITKGLDVVFIDYLQLVKPEDLKTPRALQIGQMTRELKFLAKELDVLIIMGSQLNRDIEKRIDKTPKLADLRESGDIEQDSDIVIFIDREEEYPDLIRLMIAKHRNGEKFDLNLKFRGNTMTMLDELVKYQF